MPHLQALKSFLAVVKHFAVFKEDQFDFHTYCMRKMTLRNYVNMLRMEDTILDNPNYAKVHPPGQMSVRKFGASLAICNSMSPIHALFSSDSSLFVPSEEFFSEVLQCLTPTHLKYERDLSETSIEILESHHSNQ